LRKRKRKHIATITWHLMRDVTLLADYKGSSVIAYLLTD
jgi:hypothetical protein